MAVGRGDGSYTRLLNRLAKLDLLAIDDWLLAPLRDAERRDLLEDRAERMITINGIRDHNPRNQRSRSAEYAHAR